MPETNLTCQHSGQRGSLQRERTALIVLQENYSVYSIQGDRKPLKHCIHIHAASHSELAIAHREAVQLLVASGYTIL